MGSQGAWYMIIANRYDFQQNLALNNETFGRPKLSHYVEVLKIGH